MCRKIVRSGIGLLVLLLAAVAFGQPGSGNDLRYVEAEGIGANRVEALDRAQRQAIERALGVVIGSESLVRNYALVSDWIISRSTGYVREYDVLEERPLQDGDYLVQIRAGVSPIVDDVARDELMRELLLTWVRKPELRILIREVNVEDSTSSIAETAMAAAFMNNGFVVSDRSAHPEGWKEMVGEDISGQPMDSRGQVDILILGAAHSKVGNTPQVLRGAGMVSVQANLDLRAIRWDTGEVLAAHAEQGAATHIDPVSAGAKALQNAAQRAADSLTTKLITRWALQRANAVPVEFTVDGIPFDRRVELMDRIRELPEVGSVLERAYHDGRLICIVDWQGPAGRFGDAVSGLNVGGSELRVERASWGRVDAKLDGGQ